MRLLLTSDRPVNAIQRQKTKAINVETKISLLAVPRVCCELFFIAVDSLRGFQLCSRGLRKTMAEDSSNHYDSIAVYLCLSEMGNTAGNCSLKAPFIPMGISFGSHRKRGAQLRFLSFQKR